MKSRRRIGGATLVCLLWAALAEPGWRDPKLIAGQVGFNVAVSFLGKLLIGHEPPGRALKQALTEGTASGLVAHAGYSIAGSHPEWALVGKALAQKSVLTTRRSMEGARVFDRSFLTHWEITHSFVYFKWDGAPRVEIDAINAAVAAYFVASRDRYRLDAKRSLSSGSLVLLNRDPPSGLRGYYLPGALWLDASQAENDRILAHELVHSFQAERGAAVSQWHVGRFRINWLVFASGVPAVLAGWPEHDRRLHEKEADGYAGTH